jgi:hypothetical protein
VVKGKKRLRKNRSRKDKINMNFKKVQGNFLRWAGHVSRMGEGRGVYRVLVGKPEGKRPLGRPRLDGRIMLSWIFKK